jgi:signal-transduction protein with cAMP-binding, CBS, and nucleotidyltransferase domain
MNNFVTILKSLFFNPKEYSFLHQFPILEGLTNHELYMFSQIVHVRHFKEGDIIYQEQFPLAVIYLIQSGSISIENKPEDQSNNITLHKHQFYGIVDMYNEKRRQGKAIAKTDSVLLAISNVDFQSFLKMNPRAGVKLMSNVCKSLSNYIFQDKSTLGD